MGNGPNITVVPIVCHYNYKEFYDEFLDLSIHIKVGEAAQLQWKFELATQQDMDLFPGRFLMNVKVNHRKCAQEHTTKMWPIACSAHSVEVYKVFLMTSAWLPEGAPDEEFRFPGMSFFKEIPVGFPAIQKFQPGFSADFVNFLGKVNTIIYENLTV